MYKGVTIAKNYIESRVLQFVRDGLLLIFDVHQVVYTK